MGKNGGFMGSKPLDYHGIVVIDGSYKSGAPKPLENSNLSNQPSLYSYPRCSMYGIFRYIYPKNHPNVGKYSIHGASGYDII